MRSSDVLWIVKMKLLFGIKTSAINTKAQIVSHCACQKEYGGIASDAIRLNKVTVTFSFINETQSKRSGFPRTWFSPYVLFNLQHV